MATSSSSSASKTTTDPKIVPSEGRSIDPRMIRSHRPGQPAEVFPPGEILREELEARGWTQADLATIIGRPVQVVNAIIKAKKMITPGTALALGAAFGTGPEIWLNMEMSYQLRIIPPPDPSIAERARQMTRRRNRKS